MFSNTVELFSVFGWFVTWFEVGPVGARGPVIKVDDYDGTYGVSESLVVVHLVSGA